jgi:plastocyanin
MRKMLIAVAIVALVAAGCGKSSKKSSSGTTPTSGVSAGATTTAAPPATLEGQVNDQGTTTLSGGALTLEQDDFSFKPTFVKASSGATVAVTLKNAGKNQHTFTIDSLSVDQVVDPGKTATISLRLPAGGTVAWYCRFHKSSGMQGAFVLPGASGSGPATTNPSPSPQGSYNY